MLLLSSYCCNFTYFVGHLTPQYCTMQAGNDVRLLCEHIVDKACLRIKTPQACTDELINSVLAAKQGSTAADRPLAPAAIVVPIVAAGV
jgi:hypothetical protein